MADTKSQGFLWWATQRKWLLLERVSETPQGIIEYWLLPNGDVKKLFRDNNELIWLDTVDNWCTHSSQDTTTV